MSARNHEVSADPVRVGIFWFAGIAVFAVMGMVVWFMYRSTRPAPVDQERVEERLKSLSEVRASGDELLTHYGWENQSNGVVRVPISRAMEIVVEEWRRDPAHGRARLLERLEKAHPAPPPPPPAAPNPFE